LNKDPELNSKAESSSRPSSSWSSPLDISDLRTIAKQIKDKFT